MSINAVGYFHLCFTLTEFPTPHGNPRLLLYMNTAFKYTVSNFSWLGGPLTYPLLRVAVSSANDASGLLDHL